MFVFQMPKKYLRMEMKRKRCKKNKTILTSDHQDAFLMLRVKYEGRTESREQLFFACNLVTADEREYGGSWNQLFC
jgi:hypothetical protein